MKTLICVLLLCTPVLSVEIAQSKANVPDPRHHRQDKELSGISFTITHSKHESADYTAQAQAMADALTAAGAKVRLQTYNSKTREGIYGYYGSTESPKIDAVRKLVSKTLDVKFEHSKAYDEPGANPNRMIMIYLIKNKTQ